MSNDDLIGRQLVIEKRSPQERLIIAKTLIESVLDELPSAQPTQNNRVNSNNSLDTISRQAAVELVMQYCPDDDGSCSKADRDIRELLDDFENLPSAQPEIVRCGECKYMTPEGRCLEFADDCLRPSASDFCSYAERRGANDE